MKNESIRFFVKPVKKISVQNRHNIEYKRFDPETQSLTTVANMEKTKAGTGNNQAADTIWFQKDASGTKIKAGLEEMIPNPFKGLEIIDIKRDYGLSTEWDEILKSIVDKESINLQTKMEIQDGVTPDYYTQKVTRRIPGSIFIDPTLERTFLESFKLILYDKTNIFKGDTPRGRMAIQLIKNSDDIARNKELINSRTKYYVAQEFEEEIENMDREDLVNEAIAKLYTFQKAASPEILKDLASIITDHNGRSLVSGEVNEITVKKSLNDFIKNKDSHWKNNLKKFDYALALYETNPERFVVEVMVKKAENKGLVTLVNGSVFWHSMKNRPEMYKFTSWEKFIQYILADMQRYNPAEPNTGNSYETLLNELK